MWTSKLDLPINERKSYWENNTDAPLPRRERTIRSDYNVLNRGNRHEIKEIGWVHDQNNKKIVRSDNEDLVIAMEKGYNTYKRVEDEKCSGASDWWEENKEKWELVRLKWDEVFSRNSQLSLKSQVDDKPLFMYLFTDDYNDKNTIESIIDTFVK